MVQRMAFSSHATSLVSRSRLAALARILDSMMAVCMVLSSLIRAPHLPYIRSVCLPSRTHRSVTECSLTPKGDCHHSLCASILTAK